MASYDRLGSFLRADMLATVPCGKIHRAISITGSAFERHHLLYTFSDELLDAGLATRAGEIQRMAAQLAGIRGFGANYRFEARKTPVLTCDYVPGRTLAQVLEKTREEQVPLGVDHALTVLQSLAQAIIQMHDKDVPHGALSPHSVWVGYEGATQILDAPAGAVLQALMPRAPVLKAALEPYHCAAGADPFQRDLFSLGAVFYELLTLEPPPAAAAIPEALGRATLKAAQEDGGIPEDILALVKRLLMVGQPFATAAEFSAVLERVLYDGEYSPTTFNMAFLMHTLFREENEADTQAMKADQNANYAQHQPQGGGPEAAPKAAKGPGRTLYAVIGAAAVAVLGGLYYQSSQNNRQHALELQSVQAKLAAFQKDKEAAEAKLADITKQEEAQKALEDMFGKQAEEATTQEARAAAKKDLETVRQKTRDLARQRAEALKERQRLAQQAAGPAAPAPAAPVAAPAAPAADAQPTVVRMGSPVAPGGAKAALPPAMQDTDIKVSLKVFVDAAGRPLKVVILKGAEGGYNDSAQNAALASTYAPGSKNGKPAPGWLNMEFNFGKPK